MYQHPFWERDQMFGNDVILSSPNFLAAHFPEVAAQILAYEAKPPINLLCARQGTAESPTQARGTGTHDKLRGRLHLPS